ncbi:hypothetical protein N7505_004625 [Penicillium chrysogenum]|uniref:Uncharacterized protein n=1 Tax=Penicillium chrysogenum TaxID=5076 RepID=A0ABQ8WFM3_PENCH|nr:hypothetical protein N7505_004625 [Penicillium chrysogenum]
MGHAEQCTNYLRHSIQCHADLTPMLWQKKDNSSQALQDQVTSLALDMETAYTCREWEPIYKWALSLSNENAEWHAASPVKSRSSRG